MRIKLILRRIRTQGSSVIQHLVHCTENEMKYVLDKRDGSYNTKTTITQYG